jgi:hypothetical protein
MRETVVEVCGRRYRAAAAESFLDALLGIHAVACDIEAVVIPGSSVHGFTMGRAIWAFGVDGNGDGIGGRLLRPGRVVRFPGAKHVIELVRGLHCDGEHRSHTIRSAG